VVLAPVALIVDPPLHQVTALQVAGYLWLCVAGADQRHPLDLLAKENPPQHHGGHRAQQAHCRYRHRRVALVGLIVVLASVLSIQRALARQAAGAKTKKAP
jgi:probable blue pigment (indigoidine) exporter